MSGQARGGDGGLHPSPPTLLGPRERATDPLRRKPDLLAVGKDPNPTSSPKNDILRQGCTD